MLLFLQVDFKSLGSSNIIKDTQSLFRSYKILIPTPAPLSISYQDCSSQPPRIILPSFDFSTHPHQEIIHDASFFRRNTDTQWISRNITLCPFFYIVQREKFYVKVIAAYTFGEDEIIQLTVVIMPWD